MRLAREDERVKGWQLELRMMAAVVVGREQEGFCYFLSKGGCRWVCVSENSGGRVIAVLGQRRGHRLGGCCNVPGQETPACIRSAE